jgi:hypothetical protein
MANLDLIYNEAGLKGIVPHATQEGKKGHRFLVEHLFKSTLYCLHSEATNAPFLSVTKDKVRALLFTSEDQARECETAHYVQNQFECTSKPIILESAAEIEQFCASLRALGMDSLCIDESAEIPLSTYAPKFEKTGSEQLNAVLHYYLQTQAANNANPKIYHVLSNLLSEATFILPMERMAEGDPGEIVELGDYACCAFRQNQTTLIPIFTDSYGLRSYGNDIKHDLELPLGIGELKDILDAVPNVVFILNPQNCGVRLSHAMVEQLSSGFGLQNEESTIPAGEGFRFPWMTEN